MFNDILNAFFETCIMVFSSGFFAGILGLPLGIILAVTEKNHLWENKSVHLILGFIVNATRSLPFIILMIAILPFTRWLVGSAIHIKAMIVPLTIAAIPFFARTVHIALQGLPATLIEAARSMGATPLQIIYKIMLPESMPGIVRGWTLTLVNLVGFSAMAGFNGSGGLGKLAIDHGFYRYNLEIVLITMIIMIALVRSIQSLGDYLALNLYPS